MGVTEEGERSYWKIKTKLVHFRQRHCFSLHYSCDVKIGSQTTVPANEFLNLEGNKLSTLWVWFAARFGGFSAALRHLMHQKPRIMILLERFSSEKQQ
jgi:hypothetical protein